MKRPTIKLLGLCLLLLMSFGFYICYSTGYFRPIEPHFAGQVYRQLALAGVEDMQLLPADSLLILSADDRASRRDGDTLQGHLYALDLRQEPWALRQLTTALAFPFYPHGISVVAQEPGRYQVYAINHVGDTHTIEHFEWHAGELQHVAHLSDPSMRSPNDLVALADGRFYFTNDHGYTSGLGKLAEDYLGLAAANVVYSDGAHYTEVATGIAYANGINYDPERNLLFVAAPRDFLVKVYQPAPTGELTFIEDIDCGTGVDNIEFGPDGKLWIGCHPNLLAFAAYAKGKRPHSPSEIITIDYHGKGDYELASLYLENGETMAASTVAIPWAQYIFVGNVMDESFLVLERASYN